MILYIEAPCGSFFEGHLAAMLVLISLLNEKKFSYREHVSSTLVLTFDFGLTFTPLRETI